MPKFLIAFVISLNLNICFAQTAQQCIDSATFYKNQDYARLIFWAEGAYKQAGFEKDTKCTAQSTYLLGVGNYLSGNFDQALSWYFKSDSLFTALGDMTGIITLYSDMCVFYVKLKKFDAADEVISKAIYFSGGLKDTVLLANAVNNRGLMFLDENKVERAIEAFETSYNLYKKLNDKMGMAYALDYLSSAYTEKNLYEKALSCLEESKKMRIGLGDKTGEVIAINNIGELYLKQHQTSKAIPYFIKTISKARAIKYADLEMYAHKMLAQAYAEQNNFQAAYKAQSGYLVLNQKIQDEKRINAIEELQTKYETNKKKQEIELLNDKNKIQSLLISSKNYTIFIISGIFLFSIFSAWQLYARYKIKQNINLRNEIALQQNLAARGIIEAEARERQRIASDLHDGLGQLLSIVKINTETLFERFLLKNLDANKLSEKTMVLIDESCKEVRTIAHQMMPNALLKSGLVMALHDLKNSIDSDKLHISIHISAGEERLSSDVETVLYRVIQESINNVIKHANATVLNISLMRDEKEITVTIEDNGKGFSLNDKENISGIGLKNMASRIKFLNGTVDISSEIGRGTFVAIYIPNV